MGELESLIAQMEDLVGDKDGAEAAAEAARRDADALAAQIDAARLGAGEAVRAAQAECEQLQAEVRARNVHRERWCEGASDHSVDAILEEHRLEEIRDDPPQPAWDGRADSRTWACSSMTRLRSCRAAVELRSSRSSSPLESRSCRCTLLCTLRMESRALFLRCG